MLEATIIKTGGGPTTGMHLLQSGVDLSMIAMWLGHESIQTTHQYLDADLEAKK